MKRVKIRPNSWIQDTHNGNIYYFKTVEGDDVNTLIFKKSGSIEKGNMGLNDWMKFIKATRPDRLTNQINFGKLTKNRKQNMIRNIFDET